MLNSPNNPKVRLIGWAFAACLLGSSTTLTAADGMELVQYERGAVKTVPGAKTKGKVDKVTVSPNPYLSFLPAGADKDYDYWTERLHEVAVNRIAVKKAQKGAAGLPSAAYVGAEVEGAGIIGLNDNVASAEFQPTLGTGPGDDASADIAGVLRPTPIPTSIGPFAEDDGDIIKASATNLGDDAVVTSSATIGDGPFGAPTTTEVNLGPFAEDDGDINKASATGITLLQKGLTDGVTSTVGDGPFGSAGTGSGDIDMYSFVVDISSASNSQIVILEVLNPVNDTSLDPILGVYDGSGELLFIDDDSGGALQSLLIIEFSCDPEPPCAETYYMAVTGWNAVPEPADNFLTDPFDSSTGSGVGSEGPYVATIEFTEIRSGDFDFYSVDLVAGDLITVAVDTPMPFADLDPIVAVYNPNGLLLAFNDDGSPDSFDSFVGFIAQETGMHYISVGGFNPFIFPTSPASFLADPFDSSSGPGPGSAGDYDITVLRNALDQDFYSFEAEVGDIVGVNVAACDPFSCATGESPQIGLFKENGDLLAATPADVSGIYPGTSPLPGGGNASLAYVLQEAGRYAVGVGFGLGDYDLDIDLFRPPRESSGDTQIVFIDFDGVTIDTSIYGSSIDPANQPVSLSPLSAFLSNWGLQPSDEDAVIDAILAAVREGLDADPRYTGSNPTFDVDIRNSRDHADPFPGANVSRIIVGGTIAESGISTIGIAQSVDPGNFESQETGLVLLDLLSGTVGQPDSLNSISLGPGATIIDLIGVAVGNIVVHEVGHFSSNFHTNRLNSSPNIMDSGGNLANTIGLGTDFAFGTPDDVDVDFGKDEYDPFEAFFGTEDTLNSIAFSYSTGTAPPLTGADMAGDQNANTNADVGVLLRGPGADRNFVYVMDGGSDAQLAQMAFGPETALAHTMVPDMTGDSIPEQAVLVEGSRFARIKDPTNGALLGRPFFNAALDFVGMVSVGDADNDGGQDIAVVGRDPASGLVQVQVKEIGNNTLISRYNYDKNFDPVGVAVVDNIGGSAANEIAVFGVDDEGRIRAQIKDSQTGALINLVYFDKRFHPVAVAALPDSNGNHTYVAVLGRDQRGIYRAQIKRASDATLVSLTRFEDEYYPLAFLGFVDSNASGGGEVAVVGVDVDGKVRAQVKEIETSTPVSVFSFDQNFPVVEAIGVNGAAGTGRNEIAVLGIDSGGQNRLQIKDVVTGAPVNTIFVP